MEGVDIEEDEWRLEAVSSNSCPVDLSFVVSDESKGELLFYFPVCGDRKKDVKARWPFMFLIFT